MTGAHIGLWVNRNGEAMNSTENRPDCLVHDLFRAQAARTPDRPAVISRTRTLSYGELRSLSLAWARALRELGAKPNELVAVVMEKGWEQIVAVLAILESGAAYLPLDSTVPGERLRYLLENGGVQIVLTQSRLDFKLAWPTHVKRFSVDVEIPAAGEAAPVECAQSPEDLAYVLYTSGSTGMPKGVMIAHRGLVNCILDTNRTFRVGPEDRALAVTALHHDMSVYDIFGLLAAGGAIVMPDPAAIRAPDHWVELIDREHVTLWNSVPGFMEMLLEYAAARNLWRPNCLRLAFLGGDWISVTAPHRIRTHFGKVEVVSVGGPTETTVWNIWYPVHSVDPEWKSIPYGHPIANTRYYVLDDAFQDCPVGQPGELSCAGVGLMKGYWRDEEQTRARFAIHPRTGERIYRTGDRGRLRPDGEIEFLGRIDSQVKICGQRIELGEIEVALAQYPGVRQAVVNTIQTNGQKQLVAYVVVDADQMPVARDLRQYLASRLPCYMLPSAFVRLNALPLNSNGKVDRSALPLPHVQNAESNGSIGAVFLNDLEETIRGVWRKVLRADQIEPNDNFFDLGGNSLLLVQAHSELQQRLNRALSITELFEFPSVRSLGKHLEDGRPEPLATSKMDLRAVRQREAMTQQRRVRRS